MGAPEGLRQAAPSLEEALPQRLVRNIRPARRWEREALEQEVVLAVHLAKLLTFMARKHLKAKENAAARAGWLREAASPPTTTTTTTPAFTGSGGR